MECVIKQEIADCQLTAWSTAMINVPARSHHTHNQRLFSTELYFHRLCKTGNSNFSKFLQVTNQIAAFMWTKRKVGQKNRNYLLAGVFLGECSKHLKKLIIKVHF